MKLLAFLKSPVGNLTVFVCFVTVGGLLIHRTNLREKAQAAQLVPVAARDEPPLRESIQRPGQPLAVPPRPIAPPAMRPDEPSVERETARGRREGLSDAPKPRVLPISLFTPTSTAAESTLSPVYAPFGRLISCETVVTLESSKIDTPVIGLVTEDVWHDGRLVIPAGTEVHGRAAVDRARERISASGRWVFVWRDGSALNGTELVLNAIALDREKDDTSGEFGLRDGSAGLLGTLVKTDDWQEIKLFAATFLSGFASGLQTLQDENSAFGSLAQVPIVSTRNAALHGTSDVLNAYARQIQEAIARDGFFVRVPAGKQFYLYVTETIDQAKGRRDNVANADLWKPPHAN